MAGFELATYGRFSSGHRGHYYEEARLCWYCGAYVATILIVQLAFEEFLRSFYRAARGIGAKLDSGVAIDRAGFSDLTAQARRDNFLAASETADLVWLKDCRNPYVHTRDERVKGTNFFDQLAKIAAGNIVSVTVEDEAQRAIVLLISLFPLLCQRM